MPLPLDWANIKVDFVSKKHIFDFSVNNSEQLFLGNPLKAALETIDQITQKYPPPYILYVSGGADSQAMLYAWKISGKEFIAKSAVYNEGLNQHDLCTLREFCAFNNIKVNYFDFDVINFLFNEHDTFARSYYSGSPHFTTYMKLVDMQEEGTAIMSGNFFLNGLDDNISNIPTKNVLSLYFYSFLTQKNFIPLFFIENKNLAFSFTLNSNTKNFIENFNNTEFKSKQILEKGLYDLKTLYYQTYGFPVISQESKYTGFEKVKDYFDHNYSHLVSKKDRIFRTSMQKSNRVFDLLFRNKYEARLSDHQFVINI